MSIITKMTRQCKTTTTVTFSALDLLTLLNRRTDAEITIPIHAELAINGVPTLFDAGVRFQISWEATTKDVDDAPLTTTAPPRCVHIGCGVDTASTLYWHHTSNEIRCGVCGVAFVFSLSGGAWEPKP